MIRAGIGRGIEGLEGEGAHATIDGVYLADGDELVDNHTSIDHAVAHCTSHELYKGILAGHGKAVDGKYNFLPADLDEAWIVAHREHLRRLYLAQVRALAEQCLEQGTTGTAEPHLERALTLAPSDERHYALLIRLQLAAGCPGLASHTRQRAREALAHRGWTAAGTASEMP